MTLFLAILLLPHGKPPLLAIQLLWTNLVTDAFPALALGIEPDQQHVMNDKPRHPKESLFAHGGLIYIICNGLFIGTMSLVAFRYGLSFSQETAQTMTFMVLSISQMFHSLNCRNIHQSMFAIGFFKNRALLATVILGIILQVMVTHLTFFNMIFKTIPLNMTQWLVVLVLSLAIIPINEISKFLAKE